MTNFGLALGGGGVKGLAHITLLKQLDKMGAKPSRIAGTSMGAIIGALYAAGISGEEIEKRIRAHLFTRKEGLRSFYKRRRHLVKWTKVFAIDKSRGGLITADGLFEYLFTEIKSLRFDDLQIPFKTLATDFHSGEEVVLSQGNLLEAVRASMAVPGVFAPVKLGGRLLVDGGIVNNVPCSLVKQGNSPIIASDVISLPSKPEPKSTEVLSGSLAIMLTQATRNAFAKTPPDFLFQPNTDGIDAFDFHKIGKIFERAESKLITQVDELEKLLADKA